MLWLLTPTRPEQIYISGAILISDGYPLEGRVPLLTAIRLDPHSPYTAIYMTVLAVSNYYERDYERAIEVTKRSLTRYPDDPRLHLWLAAALGQLNHTSEARAALQDAVRLFSASLDFHH